MADIFLSYARADQSRVEKLAKALEGVGYSVWWDRNIDGGSEFSQDIERELSAAGAVLVVWSETSTRSRWVRDEASMGLEEGKLVAISLDGAPPPLGFKQIHAIDMQSKSGEADLLRGLARKLGASEAAEQQPPVSSSPGRKRNTLLIATAALALLVAGTLAILQPGPLAGWFGSDAAEDGPITVAVLPFTYSADPDLDDFESSLTATLANALSASSHISVAANANTRSAAGRNLSTSEIGEELGVRYLIEGEIKSVGDNLGANLSLIEAASGRQIWGRYVTGKKAAGAFFDQDIVRALSGMLLTRAAANRGLFSLPEDLDAGARDAFLNGYELLFNRGNMTMRPLAMRQFEVATGLAPDHADAYGALGFILAESTPRDLSMSRAALENRQKEVTARALALDPGNRLARLSRASGTLNIDGNIAAALTELEALVRENPDDAFAQQALAGALTLAGRPRDALAQIDQVSRIEPLSSETFTKKILALFQIGDYTTIKQTLMTCPDPCGGGAWLWHGALLRTGSLSAYRADIAEIISMADRDPWGIPSGEMDTIARAFIHGEIGRIDPEDGVAEGFPYMQILLRFGRIEDAFRVVNRNLSYQPTIDILWLLDGSRLTVSEAIRADPRYHAIFERPRFKGIANYRREQGLTDGLPVFPVKPYTGG